MKVVAVLSGGGAKAVAHVGAVRALIEAGLAPAHYVATSFGAVMAAAMAAGAEPDTLEARLLAAGSPTIARIELMSVVKGLYADHILKAEPLRDLIGQLVGMKGFAELATPLTVTATDLDTGELVLFGAGGRMDVALADALFATCALPLYYAPAEIGGHRYADGGLRAVLPLEPARAIPADMVLAVHVGSGFDEPVVKASTAIPALVRAHGQSERIMMAAQVERTIAAWPPPESGAPRLVLVRPVRERQATFAAANARRYIEAGYRATKQALETQQVRS